MSLSLQETQTQVFSCDYCGIFKIICFEEHLRTAILSDVISSRSL